MGILEATFETLRGLPLAEDRPTAVLIIQNGDGEGLVNIHHVFAPGLVPESAAHQLMAQTIDAVCQIIGQIPPQRLEAMPEGPTSPLPAPTAPAYHETRIIDGESDGGEHD